MTKANKPTETTVGELKKALKKVTMATRAKTAALAVTPAGLTVEAATAEGYACVTVAITGAPGTPCTAQISSGLVNILLSGEESNTLLKIIQDEKGARIRYAGANLLLKTPDVSITDLFTQSYQTLATRNLVSLTGKALRDAASGAVHYMAQRDVRHYLMGVHAVERDGQLVFEGTDGFSMHANYTGIAIEAEAKGLNVIIPGHAGESMISVFDDDEAVQISRVGENLIGFRTDATYWVSNMIGAKYPDCSKFFAKEESEAKMGIEMVINKKALLTALNRVSSVAQKEGNFLRLAFAKDVLRVSSNDGENEDVVDTQYHHGLDTLECTVTTTVVLSAFEGVPGDHIVVRKGPDNHDKIYIREATKNGDHWIYSQNWQALMLPAKI